jgi:hypothetical protein
MFCPEFPGCCGFHFSPQVLRLKVKVTLPSLILLLFELKQHDMLKTKEY